MTTRPMSTSAWATTDIHRLPRGASRATRSIHKMPGLSRGISRKPRWMASM